MRTRQENFISMVRAVNKVLADNKTKWTNVKRFARAATELNDLILIMNVAGTQANSPIKGATQDKYAIEDDAIKEGIKLAKRARVYALDQKNRELEEKLKLSRSMLLRLHEDEAFKRLKDVHMQLSPIAAQLSDFGIMPADLSYFKKLIDAYEDALAKPRQLTSERKTRNENIIPDLIRKMRTVLESLDGMINLFDTTPFEADYLNVREVLKLGSRSEDDEEEDDEDEKDSEKPVEPPVA